MMNKVAKPRWIRMLKFAMIICFALSLFLTIGIIVIKGYSLAWVEPLRKELVNEGMTNKVVKELTNEDLSKIYNERYGKTPSEKVAWTFGIPQSSFTKCLLIINVIGLAIVWIWEDFIIPSRITEEK